MFGYQPPPLPPPPPFDVLGLAQYETDLASYQREKAARDDSIRTEQAVWIVFFACGIIAGISIAGATIFLATGFIGLIVGLCFCVAFFLAVREVRRRLP